MDPVYEKLALRIAELEIDKAILSVELKYARDELAKRQAEAETE